MATGVDSQDANSHQRAEFRPCQASDAEAAAELLNGPLDSDHAVAHWLWKLKHWDSSAENVWIASFEDKFVFHYGGIPLHFRVDGSIVDVMISVDAMTAPDHRRKGLLTEGVRHAFQNWKSHDIAFTLGLPNEQWGSRTSAAGWIELFPLRWLVRPIRPERIAA